jgi:hypothetical protein
LILVLIVWWTMSGRNENKPNDKDPAKNQHSHMKNDDDHDCCECEIHDIRDLHAVLSYTIESFVRPKIKHKHDVV